ncbi:Glycine oxidase [Methyloligella halotolerans]|uniref:D-amino-acid oxidase n=1 Tax=Methyloligella halotolerans TaxID=1177755 RepID=A0A1E2RZD3_9HYPH|nr:FAD-dependent oxidoreductase [Methyloligella halotolerans]ODA67458.1 Glycine oxidase [Methyloligella halotolerans]
MTEKPSTLAIRGAGITGLWQALMLARKGYDVTVYERSETPFTDTASRWAAAMLAPRCEEESAERFVRDLGLRSIALWQESYPGTIVNGSLVLTLPRDRPLLERFSRMTSRHERIGRERIEELEPGLADRFETALFFEDEAHFPPEAAMAWAQEAAEVAGAKFVFGTEDYDRNADLVIDCRGMGARDDLPGLRGVRGERIIVRSGEIELSRPIRLLHPRQSLYVVPRGNQEYMLGATAIESDEGGLISVRSTLDLLGAAYALDPAFGEAEIVDQGAGVRPAFPDNRPRIILSPRYIYVNGLFRHGFLLAPALGELVANYLEDGTREEEIFADSREW